MTKITSQVPRETVQELDQYIIGQHPAKRSVAIALRNRWRRQQVESPLREEIAPKNIIMIGPTGVGKTEIARRLANLANSPFVKVEASKFTEVGYVGRDVESMIRDLVQLAINMIRNEEQEHIQEKAEKIAEEKILDILLPPVGREPGSQYSKPDTNVINLPYGGNQPDESASGQADVSASTREKFRQMLREGKLDDRMVEMDVPDQSSMPMVEVFSASGMDDMQSSLQDAFGKFVEAEACEVHLATNFQNIFYDFAPDELVKEIYAYLGENHSNERKPDMTDDQFNYKTRKRAFGPFKPQIWALPAETKQKITAQWDVQFQQLFESLAIADTKKYADQFTTRVDVLPNLASYIKIAGGETVEEDTSDLAD